MSSGIRTCTPVNPKPSDPQVDLRHHSLDAKRRLIMRKALDISVWEDRLNKNDPCYRVLRAAWRINVFVAFVFVNSRVVLVWC
jgi:hypothetical protein